MKRITLSASEYHDFVYGAVANTREADVKKFRIALRVLELLEDQGKPPKSRFDQFEGTELDEIMRCSQYLLDRGFNVNASDNWHLKEKEATFEFDDLHVEFIIRRLEESLGQLPLGRARHVIEIIDRLKETTRESKPKRKKKT